MYDVDILTNPEEYYRLYQMSAETAYYFAGDFMDMDPAAEPRGSESAEQLHEGQLAESFREVWEHTCQPALPARNPYAVYWDQILPREWFEES